MDIRTITIPTGQTTSAAIDLFRSYAATLVALSTPSSLTLTSLTFEVSADGVTYQPLYDKEGQPVTIYVAANRYITLDPALFAGIRYLRLVGNAAVAADRTFTLITRKVAP
jgi:hypothetical protein